ncbi:MAG TPA: ATP-binding protein [Stellaceae bacterium]|nr:ATP-binding protein [Stellaceae bacterium]
MFRRDIRSFFAPARRPAAAGVYAVKPRKPAPERRPRRFLLASEYLVIAFTAFLIALIWGAIGCQLDHDRSGVIDAAQANTSNMARAYAEHVQGTLQLLDQALLRVKSEYETKSSDPAFLRRALSDERFEAQVVPMGVVSRDGYIVASNLSGGPHPGLPTTASPAVNYAGDRDYFHAQLANDAGVYVSAPIVSRVTGKTTIALSRRLNDAHGGFAGIVFASFDLDYLTGFFSDLAIGKTSSFSIVGTDRVIRDMIRGNSRANELVGESISRPSLLPALSEAASGDYQAISPIDGVEHLYSYRSLSKYHLIVLASAARPDILADFEERKRAMLLTGALLSAIFIAVAAFQLQRIARTRRYEVALNRSNEKLARAQQLATIGCFEHNVTTGEAEWSDELYRILGLEPTGAIPDRDTLMALIHPEDRARFEEYRNAEIEGKPTPPLEYRIQRADGTERIVRRETGVVVDKETHHVHRYGTLQDITALRLAEQRERELERKLLHSQKLEALGTLAGGIAHDLNNTLTPIMALSKLTARRLTDDDNLRRNLETIFAASEQARDLVRRVLSFSRREKIEKTVVNPSIIVGDAVALLRATTPSSIKLTSQIDDVPPILADPTQIHQVITNLIANATQAIGADAGTITVILAPSGRGKLGGQILLSVIDTGKGMDEATRQRIFEPFFTTKEVGQGTGLGLSIIDGIVNNHGGHIEVASEPGKGTRFDVYFPVAAAGEAPVAAFNETPAAA